jgi:hypothetical protein
MITGDVLSDQYYQWSDAYAENIHIVAEKETSRTIEKASRSPKAYSRVANRALQAMWKSWMQMCDRRRTWAEALPFHTSAGQHPVDGIRAALIRGRGQGISRELSAHSPCSRRDMPNQSGVITAKGIALIDERRAEREASTESRDACCEHPGRDPPCREL